MMTKANMIETLKLREAKQWTAYQNQREWCKVFFRDKEESEWSGIPQDALNIYMKEWSATFDILQLLKIEPYTWSERQQLIIESKI